jgi:hypothetical protein
VAAADVKQYFPSGLKIDDTLASPTAPPKTAPKKA